MADYRNAVDEQNAKSLGVGATLDSVAKLRDFLNQKEQFEAQQKQQKDLQAAHAQSDLAKQQQEYALKDQGANTRFAQAQEFSKQNPNLGVSIGADSAAITPKPDMSIYHKNAMDERHEQAVRRQMADYSKRLEKHNGFTTALTDVEKMTDRDGSGGILTNPNATLVSTGKLTSAIPTVAMGLGEMVGVAPKGAAEERKALERLQLEYQKSMTGARTSDEMRKAEKQAMGWISSGDPKLVQKGIQSLARNVQGAVRATQAGYVPEVRERVHAEMGDPSELLSQVAPQEALPQLKSRMQHASAPASSPQPQPSSGAPMSFEEFKKRKAAGQL